ncbi:hypothetical protein V5O48_004350 [Marasmius crinis-equi]|uniref:U2 snRNP-associated SURP motif-containing protein n=1 Tax=Marasmius crinis-equi TaxID=585013 RepID=A0ABR3FQA9_9AGAR
MDKNKVKIASKLSNFFEDDDEEPPFPHKAVDDAKLTQYAAGSHRKSRREKEQEVAEAKKREEEVNAAQAYAEFLDAFEGEGVGRRGESSFVKASSSSGSAYNPARGFSSMPGPKARKSSPPPISGPPKPKGKREMDSFLEELKKDQAVREAKYSRHAQGRSVTAMAAYEGQSGSKDRGDPQTSNVFVANLPPHVTEQSLGNFFARAGPVGSVKIMWPRNDASTGPGADMTASRRSKNSGLSGFVSFMTRKDAEEALREFDGFDWGGSVLRVGWSKAVPIAAKPMYDGAVAVEAQVTETDALTPANLVGPTDRAAGLGTVALIHRSGIDDPDRDPEVVRPRGVVVRSARTATMKSLPIPSYHRRHAFYKGLVEDERPMSPEFDDEGYNSVYSTDSAEESERERVRKVKLGKLARKRFEAMLRAMSGKRGEVARCMAFSLEHAEAAHEVADIIVASLLVDGTPVPRKVARLHLICDILHNSAASVPSAWKFRQEFQARLGIVFDHMANIYHSFPGRITADIFKKQITSIVDVWEDWIVFPPDFTSELRERLEGMSDESQSTATAQQKEEKSTVYASRFKASTFKAAEELAEELPVAEAQPSTANVDGEPIDDDVDGTPMDDVDGAPMNEDIDGAPIDEDIDGAPIDEDLDGAPIADDIDGAPIEDDDIDGAPIDNDASGKPMEDVDGEPMDMEDDD